VGRDTVASLSEGHAGFRRVTRIATGAKRTGWGSRPKLALSGDGREVRRPIGDLRSVDALPHKMLVMHAHTLVLSEVESREFGEFVHDRDHLSKDPSAVGGMLRDCGESGEA